jgi:ABC-2 type transport system permease protein
MTTTIRARLAGAAQIPPIPFARLLRAEWHKTISTRAARWLLVATAVTTIGALAVPLLFPRDITQSRASYPAWAGLGLTRLLPLVLMLTMTAEWSQRTAMTTFTQEPRRGRVLAAKILTGQAVCLAGATFAFLAAQAVVLAANAAGRHIGTGWDWPQLAGFVAFILLTGTIGIAFGALLHNTAVAIVTYFALAGAFNLLMIPALQAAGRWVNTGQTYGWVLYGHWVAHDAQIATSSLLWIALPLTLGLFRTLRREVH